MANNNLRRQISSWLQRDRAVPTAVSADDLLARALSALGGPVEDNRPAGVTVGEGLPAIPHINEAMGFSENIIVIPDVAMPVGRIELRDLKSGKTLGVIVGADPGDENDAH